MSLPKHITFNAPSELYAAAAAAPQTGNHGRQGHHSSSDLEWWGTRTFEEALQLGQSGWPQGVQTAYKLAQTLSADMVSALARPQIEYDVTGDAFDMGKVVEDVPECWMTWTQGQHTADMKESARGPVSIVYNSGARCGVSGDTITRKGAAVMALVIVLQAAQRPVRVLIGTHCMEGVSHSTLFKDYYDDLQADALAFGMMHPAMHRRINFSIRCAQGLRSAGSSCDLTIAKGDIYIGHVSEDAGHWGTNERAEKWVRSQLELQGIRFVGGNYGR